MNNLINNRNFLLESKPILIFTNNNLKESLLYFIKDIYIMLIKIYLIRLCLVHLIVMVCNYSYTYKEDIIFSKFINQNKNYLNLKIYIAFRTSKIALFGKVLKDMNKTIKRKKIVEIYSRWIKGFQKNREILIGSTIYTDYTP